MLYCRYRCRHCHRRLVVEDSVAVAKAAEDKAATVVVTAGRATAAAALVAVERARVAAARARVAGARVAVAREPGPRPQ